MVFPGGVATTTFQFNLMAGGATEEMAQFDLTWRTVSGTSPSDWSTYLTDLATSCYNQWVAAADTTWYSGSVELAQVIARGFDDTGHTAAEETYAPGTLWVGTATGPSMPWQCSYCVGLYAYEPNTFVTQGRNKRGRFYLPPFISTRADTNANANLSPGTVTALLTAMGGMINAIEDDLGGIAGIVVLSRKLQETFDATWLRGDGVIDTQRRRVRSEPKTIQKFDLGA
jgi:hypothetical protein